MQIDEIALDEADNDGLTTELMRLRVSTAAGSDVHALSSIDWEPIETSYALRYLLLNELRIPIGTGHSQRILLRIDLPIPVDQAPD
jgi:hypothetical protein